MPTIAWFYGIAIRICVREHPPAHFHAVYGEHETFVHRPGRGDLTTHALVAVDRLG